MGWGGEPQKNKCHSEKYMKPVKTAEMRGDESRASWGSLEPTPGHEARESSEPRSESHSSKHMAVN